MGRPQPLRAAPFPGLETLTVRAKRSVRQAGSMGTSVSLSSSLGWVTSRSSSCLKVPSMADCNLDSSLTRLFVRAFLTTRMKREQGFNLSASLFLFPLSFETESHLAALAGLELTMETRQASGSQRSTCWD